MIAGNDAAATRPAGRAELKKRHGGFEKKQGQQSIAASPGLLSV
jgi:hypothetical protein